MLPRQCGLDVCQTDCRLKQWSDSIKLVLVQCGIPLAASTGVIVHTSDNDLTRCFSLATTVLWSACRDHQTAACQGNLCCHFTTWRA